MKNLLLLLGSLGMLMVGCSSEQQNKSQAPQQMPPLPVKAYEVTLEDANFSKRYSALLTPFQEVVVLARVNGVLLKKSFVEGSYVKEGEILYEIQKDEYRAALDLAHATLAKAEANYKKVAKDYARGEYLFKNAAISEQQFDDLEFQKNSAEAEYKSAKASLDKAAIEYSYTTIKAPISGKIGISHSDEGSLISTSNTQLTTITALDPLYAEFSLPNSDVIKYRSQIKLGAKVSMVQGEKKYEGVIDFIDSTLDSKTDTLLLRAKFANKSGELVIGSYAELVIDGFSYKNAASIPEYALIKTPQGSVVYVIGEDGSLSMQGVAIAHVKDGSAIVTSGLNGGEKIVVSNIAKLRPNSKVQIIGGN